MVEGQEWNPHSAGQKHQSLTPVHLSALLNVLHRWHVMCQDFSCFQDFSKISLHLQIFLKEAKLQSLV